MYNLEQIFSVRNERCRYKKHKVITILGLKLKFKVETKFKTDFFNREISPNTILLVEPNYVCHRETLPGVTKYLIDLGYNVDILLSDFEDNSLCNYPYDVKIFKYTREQVASLMRNPKLSKYERVIFNSKVVYLNSKDWLDIHEYFDDLKSGKKQNIYVQHHIDRINEIPEDKQIILANPAQIEEYESIVVNPHYFGNVKITDLNRPRIKFCIIGALENKRKNVDLLFNSIRTLESSGVDNYEILIAGRFQEKLENLEPVFQEHIVLKGRLNFAEMYQVLEESDYFIPLLDPDNPEHDRYIKDGTSGGFQLVYGFLKPCIIQEKFAKVYNFNDTNSIVYAKNEDLGSAMKKAINLNSNEYKILQNNLLKMQKEIYSKSLKNFDKILRGK